MIKGQRDDGDQHRAPRLPHAPPPRMILDRSTKAIIEQLQQDGRRSFAAIAGSVGLTEEAVRQRVGQLVDAGVMQIVAVTDPLQLGFARQAMIGVIVDGPLKPVAEALADIEEVDYVVITAGGFDILAEVVGRERRPPARAGHRTDQAHPRRDLDPHLPLPGAGEADLHLGRARARLRRHTGTLPGGLTPPSRPRPSRPGLLDLDLLVGVPLADHLLVELADARARHLRR